MSEATIYNLEKGYSKPSIQSYPRIIKYIGYHPFDSDDLSTGKKVLIYRQKFGITSNKLAEMIRVDQASISRFERDVKGMNRAVRIKILKILNH